MFAIIQLVKGTKDILPEEIYKWQYVEAMFIDICRDFGFSEIRFPVFEDTSLFTRGVGETTDIVQKEMYTFSVKEDGQSITLRPEGTASVVRSYIQNGMSSLPQPVKLCYNITAYRRENPQKGRYREFHQFGLEAFGTSLPSVDVEIISLVNLFFTKLGINNVSLNINSIGCPKCRADYNQKLKDFFRPNLNNLCNTCQDRFDRNPMRIIDCKEAKCKEINKNAPAMIDNICDECENHFNQVKMGLDNLGIKYIVDKNIVRGLDYYTKTVFEFVTDQIGAQGTVCGGGRYDGLVEEIGGAPTPGIGFAMGVERLLMIMEAAKIEIPKKENNGIYLIGIGEESIKCVEKLVFELRQNGIKAEKDLTGRKVKGQMQYANKLGFSYTAVIGETEIAEGKLKIKNMKTGESIETDFNIKNWGII